MPATQRGSGLAILAGFIAVVIGLGVTTLLAFPSRTAIVRTYLLLLIGLVVFVSTRHAQIVRRRSTPKVARQGTQTTRSREVDYNLFVLGSGGHTKEMLMMMDDGFCSFQHFHRRYLISIGDRMSENHLEDYEAELKTLCDARGQVPGTYDKCIVARARRVHQPLWSTPLTALLSILDIFPVLLSPPANEVGAKLRYPTKIFSNGPATGFFVGVAVHLLKMFYVVPEDTMMFVYIESWARISTLSLTGKLFFYTGFADTFLVQHNEVAANYGIKNAGEMVFNSRRPEI
ncbi:UDP-N-acetylglucosamine transferase subunit [Neonectria punicea]|uniref:UDP-N-acetylglucosamine transferase subunit ALG14 n=1 Tax=Neonectria punicea TaxID=979145 RepID=A0ABR1H0M2_9HYPO